VDAADEHALEPPPPRTGELLRIDDIETGFSPMNPKKCRPYLVIGVAGQLVRVMPQSRDTERGVYVPDGAVDGLEAGCFVPWATNIPVSLAVTRPTIGTGLPSAYLEQMLEQAKPRPRQR
jgi:hypothetical protein